MRNNMEKSTEPAKLKENGDKKNTKQQGKCRSISYPSTCLCEYFGRNKYHEPMTCQKVLDSIAAIYSPPTVVA
ncbi:hypothetical protein KIN20_032496 [Parelaphostrongylus tenuis]|uniref:Uncharacterized protein n=1 Tax=Parelaphostrongylus tenuis TaxID=148309 RepID=A0AAD5R6T8_PARTN|nr:hypothetical protein KIN20_032496 [Parelaphostrongylus tenuis]